MVSLHVLAAHVPFGLVLVVASEPGLVPHVEALCRDPPVDLGGNIDDGNVPPIAFVANDDGRKVGETLNERILGTYS